jgi:uronate dehydrogenase
MDRLRVFLTGATGRVGRVLVPAFREVYALRTLHRRPPEDDATAVLGDLQEPERLRALMEGFEVVVHLAAVSHEAPFVEEIVPANVVGAYNVFRAAHDAGARRIVFASTCHLVQFRQPEHTILTTDPYRPVTTYGVSKAFGEVLGRYYHDKFGMEFVAVRIGWLLPYDDPELRTSAPKRGIWLSPRDAVALFRLAVERPGVGYTVVFGISATDREVVSLGAAREALGYEPADDVVKLYGPFGCAQGRPGPQAV